jgi:hypothetical protein
MIHAGALTVLPFDPSQLGLFALPLQGANVTPVGPGEVLDRANAAAALNGPMFGVCPGQSLPSGNAQYAASQCDTLSYAHYDAGTGLLIPGSFAGRGITIAAVDGHAQASSGDSYPPGASVAVQLYPSLIEAGRITASATVNLDRVWRSGLAILNTGQLAFVVGLLPMVDFAQALLDFGAVDAGYTDGGGSSALVTRDGVAGATEHRPVASWLIVKKPAGFFSSPGIMAPGKDRRLLLWSGAALAAVILLLLSRKT